MRGAHFFRNLLCAIGLGAGVSAGQDQLDCTKFEEALCNMIKNTQSDTVRFNVLVAFYPPEQDTACKGVDPRTDTSGKCDRVGWDSAYKAKLIRESRDLFTKYEFWSGTNPTVRIQPPTEPKYAFWNILATKAALIGVSQESYVSVIERHVEGNPLGVETNFKKTKNQGGIGGDAFLINGRKLNQKLPKIPEIVRPAK